MIIAKPEASQLAILIKDVVEEWLGSTDFDSAVAALADPKDLGVRLSYELAIKMAEQGINPLLIQRLVRESPCLHLEGVFEATETCLTPEGFCPVPDTRFTVAARAAAIALHAQAGLATVSYGTENDGALFVNLVTMPGEGIFAEKSQRRMRGHTDAVSFPFKGCSDPLNPNIAPSPDTVCLLGLRNPNEVPTTVMVLQDMLQLLTAEQIEELKKERFYISAQKSFEQNTREVLGESHTVDGGVVLHDAQGQTWVRYSHSHVDAITEDGPDKDAIAALEAACGRTAQPIIVRPGDILVINNRLSLHGRGEVGVEIGGNSRWLLRTYGLEVDAMTDAQRSLVKGHQLFP